MTYFVLLFFFSFANDIKKRASSYRGVQFLFPEGYLGGVSLSGAHQVRAPHGSGRGGGVEGG
jgi:hypothetical protein